MNIALIGFRGTGKTSVGKLLAKSLDKKLISTDEEVIKKIKASIPNFVKRYDLEKLREIETEVIEHISDSDECIFDAGFGIVMRNENILNLKKNSLIILLTADIRTIAKRIKMGEGKPLIDSNFISGIKATLREYEPRYKKAADYSIGTSGLSPEEACDLILHYVQMELE